MQRKRKVRIAEVKVAEGGRRTEAVGRGNIGEGNKRLREQTRRNQGKKISD